MHFLLLASPALADPPEVPPDDGVVAEVGVQVEMAPVLVRGTILETGVWSGVPDAMALEVALTEHQIPAQDTSLLLATPSTLASGEAVVRIEWVGLGDGVERFAEEKKARGRSCTDRALVGFWTGGNDVLVYSPSSAWAAANLVRPMLVLVDHHPRIGAMVELAPGDTVTVQDLRKDGVVAREIVTITRTSGSLVIERVDGADRVCFVAAGE